MSYPIVRLRSDATIEEQLFLKLVSTLSHEGFDTPHRLIRACTSGRR